MLPLRHHHASWHTIPRRIAFAVILMFFVSLLLCTASVSHPAHAAHLAALQSCTSSSAPGVTMTCTISTAAEIDSITLTGTSGEVYLLRVAVTAGTMHPLVRVNGPGGTLICQTSSPYSLGAEIAGCILTQSGTQTISISDTAATATGSYNLYVQRLSAPANPTPLIIGEVHPATITTGAEATTFTFTGSANDAYLLRMGVTAGSLRPSVRVFGADGTMICSASQPYALGTEITRCLLPQSGTYTVLAADTSVALTGSYNVSIQRLTTPVGATALTMGATATATIQVSSDANFFTPMTIRTFPRGWSGRRRWRWHGSGFLGAGFTGTIVLQAHQSCRGSRNGSSLRPSAMGATWNYPPETSTSGCCGSTSHWSRTCGIIFAVSRVPFPPKCYPTIEGFSAAACGCRCAGGVVVAFWALASRAR